MIKYWGKLPLKPHIYIKVVDLVVILNKGREEQFFGNVRSSRGPISMKSALLYGSGSIILL